MSLSNFLARILIVDDEEDILVIFKKGLERNGFKVDTICSPLDAIAKFKAGVYDMVILDVLMPEIDGFDLYEQLSKIDSKPRICFLTAAFDSNNYTDKIKGRYPDISTHCFIKKPLSLDNLIKIIKAELNIHL